MTKHQLKRLQRAEKAEAQGRDVHPTANVRPVVMNPPDAVMDAVADAFRISKPRIWALHCPFTKTGFPVLGNFGRTVRPVVVIPMATWTSLCKSIPELGAMRFDVGTVE